MSAIGSGHFTLSDIVVVLLGWNFFLLSVKILDMLAIEEIDFTVGD